MATSVINMYSRREVELERLGEGSISEVFKGYISDSNVPVAVKKFKNELSDSERKTVINEVRTLATLRHPNIVGILDVVNDRIPWIVTEFIPDGNLLTFVNQNPVSESTLIKMCLDICNGMKYLHSRDIIHGSLSARNILLQGRTPKITDTALATMSALQLSKGDNYTMRHAAKEYFTENIVTFASDAWSFGVTMYEIFNGGLGLYHGIPLFQLRGYISNDGTPLTAYPLNHVSPDIVKAMTSILVSDWKRRPNFVKLCQTFGALRLRSHPKLLDANSFEGRDVYFSAPPGATYIPKRRKYIRKMRGHLEMMAVENEQTLRPFRTVLSAREMSPAEDRETFVREPSPMMEAPVSPVANGVPASHKFIAAPVVQQHTFGGHQGHTPVRRFANIYAQNGFAPRVAPMTAAM